MRSRGRAALVLLVACALGAAVWTPPVRGAAPIVRAVLFYAPSCPHCHQVMTVDLPPLQVRYGSRLEIAALDVTTASGAALYQAAVTRFAVPAERTGVPALFVGDSVLVGSLEIPQQLPGMIDRLLALGGADWPDIPGLAAALPAATRSPGTSTDPATAPETQANAGPLDRVARDPAGNSLALGVLVALFASLGWAGVVLWRGSRRAGGRAPSGLIPALAVAGLAVSLYLAVVETSGSAAVCGPVGDCNTVQQSEYARLLGVLPIGVLGIFGYLAVLAAWVAARFGGRRIAKVSRIGLLGLALAGTLFSVYLTFLEPFVIGATCAWCLTSALLMDVMLLTVVVSGVPRPSDQPTPPRRRAA